MALSRRAMLAGGAVVATGVAARAVSLRPTVLPPSGRLAAIVPPAFGRWRMVDTADPVLPDVEEQRTVEAAYEDVLARTYADPASDGVMLVVARSRPGSGLLYLHRPEVCYAAQGFAVLPFGDTPLPAPFAATLGHELVAVRGDRHESILYWGTVGGRQSAVGLTQKLGMLRAAWRGEALDAYLVRMSLVGAEGPEAFATLRRFAHDLVAGLPLPYRGRLSGLA
jgi:EpsI family protein